MYYLEWPGALVVSTLNASMLFVASSKLSLDSEGGRRGMFCIGIVAAMCVLTCGIQIIVVNVPIDVSKCVLLHTAGVCLVVSSIYSSSRRRAFRFTISELLATSLGVALLCLATPYYISIFILTRFQIPGLILCIAAERTGQCASAWMMTSAAVLFGVSLMRAARLLEHMTATMVTQCCCEVLVFALATMLSRKGTWPVPVPGHVGRERAVGEAEER